MRASRFSCLAIAIAFGLASPAFAQQPGGVTATVQTEQPPPPPPPPPPQQTVVITHDAGTPAPRIVQVERGNDYLRVHFHGGLAGGFIVGNLNGGFGGLNLGLGIQFNSLFAIYAQSIGLLGAFIDAPNYAGAFAAFWFNSILAELTFAHFFQIGFGPSLDFLGVAGCDPSMCNAGSAGPYFGLDGKVALAIGGHDIGTRGAFFIAADLHPIFYDSGAGLNAVFALIFSLGGQVY